MLRRVALVFALTFAPAASLEAQSIFTVAGGGTDDGRPATVASFMVDDVDVDGSGNLFIVDSADSRVRRVDAATGIVTTIAGSGAEAFRGDGGPATLAALNQPAAVTVDSEGNVYIVDRSNERVRKIGAASGIITTVAGGGEIIKDGVAATASRLARPVSVALSPGGDLYIGTDPGIRRVDQSTGLISAIVGCYWPCDDGYDGTDDGIPATRAKSFGDLSGFSFDISGDLYFAQPSSNRIRRVDASTGILTTFAGTGEWGFGGDGGPATAALFSYPTSVAFDAAGNLYVADRGNRRVRRIAAGTGVITTVAGDGGTEYGGDGGHATSTSLRLPDNVAVDSAGNLIFGDWTRVLRVDKASGIISTIAGNGRRAFVGDDGPATAASLRNNSAGIAVDRSGNLYIADSDHNRVRRVDRGSGTITTVAGNGEEGNDPGDGGPAINAALSSPRDIALDGDHLYISDQGNNRVRRVDLTTGIITTVAGNGVRGFEGDGGPATEAALVRPGWIDIDGSGNLYIDVGSGQFDFPRGVWHVDLSTGTIRTLFSLEPSSWDFICGLAVDSEGSLFVNYPIQGCGPSQPERGIGKVDLETGDIELVQRTSAVVWELDFGPEGNIYFADPNQGGIFRVDAVTGSEQMVAGVVHRPFAGDGGPATGAVLGAADTVTVDEEGNIYTIGTANRVRAIYKCVEVEDPLPMTPGDGASGVPTSVALAWKRVSGAFRYDVYLDTADPAQTIVASGIETTTFSTSNLLPLTTYYWKIVAKGDPFCEPMSTAPSEVWSFTTTSTCDVPGAFATGD